MFLARRPKNTVGRLVCLSLSFFLYVLSVLLMWSAQQQFFCFCFLSLEFVFVFRLSVKKSVGSRVEQMGRSDDWKQ